jgi:hypothetical protein
MQRAGLVDSSPPPTRCLDLEAAALAGLDAGIKRVLRNVARVGKGALRA